MKTILQFILILILLAGCNTNKSKTIIVAGILPLTGAGAEAGTSAKNATEFCIYKWNTKGGIMNIPIKSEFLDSKADPKLGHSLASKLANFSHPNIVVEGISGVVLNTQPILERNKIIQLAIVATDNILINDPQYTIRNYTIPSEICRQFFNELQNKFKKKEFMLFYANTEYALTFKKEFERQAATQNINIKGIQIYDENDLSYRNIILKSNLNNDDVIYISGQYQALGRLVKQLRESGHIGYIVSDSHLNSQSVLNAIGSNQKNLSYINIKKTPATMALMAEYEKKYNTPMDDFALLTFNGLNILLTYMYEHNTIDNSEIMKNINGYEYNGPIGKSKIKNNDVLIEFELKDL